MKTLGLIGGTTWVSTVDYYAYINQLTNEKLGANSSARLLLYSVNFQEYLPRAEAGAWSSIGESLSTLARQLEANGAEAVVLCVNTMHIVPEQVQASIGIPLLHIVKAVAREIRQSHLQKVALLGTRFTMQHHFYPDILRRSGIETIRPTPAEQEFIHQAIFAELQKQILRDETRRGYLEIIDALAHRGAQGVMLACTEIPLLVKQEHCRLPIFDST
ncbi:MAG: amino acid racemase [Chthoniobacterales bacterium]|nr:amino acid racemase [Chthoniobacterales bacterium]